MAKIIVMENEFSEAQTAATEISSKFGISYDNAICYLVVNASFRTDEETDTFVSSTENRTLSSEEYLNEYLLASGAEDISFNETSILSPIAGIEDLLF